eukprot:155923-Pyramimonas_sp.AAC.1
MRTCRRSQTTRVRDRQAPRFTAGSRLWGWRLSASVLGGSGLSRSGPWKVLVASASAGSP